MDQTIVWIAPILISTAFPVIRVFRGRGILSSFFIGWALLIFWIFVFGAAAPFVVPKLHPAAAIEWSDAFPRPIWQHLIPGVFFGWFYAALAVLAGLFLRRLIGRAPVQDGTIANPNLAKRKGCATAAIVFLAALGSLFAWFYYTNQPPKEATLLQTFYEHRDSFDRLRDMLQADVQIHRIAGWGVDMEKSGISKPPASLFPVQRFDEYLALFKETGTEAAWRGDGPSPDVGISVWGSGFAGDTVHIGFCWTTSVPDRQVSNLDLYLLNHRSSGTKGDVYRHIEGNWYLYTDIATR